MDTGETHVAVYVLLGVVALFVTGLVLGFAALKLPLLERFVFNSVALVADVDSTLKIGITILFPPLIAIYGAWYVLAAAGRADPMEGEK